MTAFGINAVKLLIYSALINGILAAQFLVLVMLIAGDREIMGKHRNHRLATVMGWLTTVLMAGAAITYLVITYL